MWKSISKPDLYAIWMLFRESSLFSLHLPFANMKPHVRRRCFANVWNIQVHKCTNNMLDVGFWNVFLGKAAIKILTTVELPLDLPVQKLFSHHVKINVKIAAKATRILSCALYDLWHCCSQGMLKWVACLQVTKRKRCRLLDFDENDGMVCLITCLAKRQRAVVSVSSALTIKDSLSSELMWWASVSFVVSALCPLVLWERFFEGMYTTI